MAPLLGTLDRYARPILLLVSGLVAVGAVLAAMGMLVFGWSMYTVGYLALLIALPTVAVMCRRSLDWFGWLTFAVLYAGLLLGVPVVLTMWRYYVENPAVRGLVMPYNVIGLGVYAAIIFWVGLGFFGWALYRVRAVPVGGPVLFFMAAVLGLLGENGWLPTIAWPLGVLFAMLGLVWIAPEPQVSEAPAA